MKFYDCATAPSPRRVRIFLAEKGADIPTEQVDLASGAHFSDEFRQLNPDCTVPVLELDDGRTISECVAICDYLEHCFPDPPLLGTTPEERAEVLAWNGRIEVQCLHALAEMFRNQSKAMANRALPGPQRHAQIPALVDRGRRRAEAFFDRLDVHLEDRDVIAGEHYSMADITALVAIDFAKWSKLDAGDGRPAIARWYEAAAARAGSVS